jgi:hypothetical protein
MLHTNIIRKIKILSILSTAINQHTSWMPARCFQRLFWMNYMCTIWLGFTNFPKILRPFQKPWIHNSDTKEIQNSKYSHSLCVVEHMIWKCLNYICQLTQSCKWLLFLWIIEIQSSYAFWRLYTVKSKTLIMEKMKYVVMCVSNSVARNTTMCILKLALQQNICTESGGRSIWYLCLHLGRSTIHGLRHIILLLYLPSCTER